jgi:GT2 family glycosyltransferase
MVNKRKLSIVMVTYNSFPFFKDSTELLIKHIKSIDLEIIIVDNKSTQIETIECLDELKEKYSSIVKIVKLNSNSGYPTAMNIGMNYTLNDMVLTLDNDVFVDSNSDKYFVEMYDLIENNLDYGLISPLFLKEDSTPDINYFITFNIFQMLYERFSRMFSDKSKHDSLSRLSKLPKDQNGCFSVELIAAQFFLMRKSVYFNILKGWDTRYFLGLSDSDVCKTLTFYGLKNIIYPKGKMVHGCSKTNNHESVRFFVLYDNFRTFGQFMMKWKIMPFIRNSIYKIIFIIPTWIEIIFRAIVGNKTVSD